MSRGGRGGFGGGRPNEGGKMGGQALPWEYDPDLDGKLNTKPSETFPPIQPPIAEPPSAEEKRIIHHYRTLRARIHDGPLYTVLGDNVRVSKTGWRSPPAAHFDPFEGQPTYTQRYRKKRNTLPRLSTRPFVKELFPKELYSTLDPSDKTNVKKTLAFSTRNRLDKFMADSYNDDDPERAPNDDDEENPENEDDAEKVDPENEGDEDEDPDQFDDEDDNDDYNAEQYFDGGDDDDYGDEGGGGGGGDDDGY